MSNRRTSLKYIFFTLGIVYLISFSAFKTYAQTPAAPSGLAAVGIYYDQMKLTWNDNSGDEIGFKVLRVLSPGVYQQVGTTGANDTLHYLFGLTPNTTYTFVVLAYNNFGNSPYSNEASATTPYNQGGTPEAPSELRMTDATSSSITIEWEDNSFNEQGFKIARRLKGDTNFVIIDSVASDVLTYREVGLSPASDYFYKVCAYNRYGFSDYTNVVTARTLEGSVGIEPEPGIPSEFYLKNNYPNPFNPETTIEFGISANSSVKLTVYNSLGKEVDVLLNRRLQAGAYSVKWNAAGYNSGIYFYRIDVEDAGDIYSDVKKMIVIK